MNQQKKIIILASAGILVLVILMVVFIQNTSQKPSDITNETITNSQGAPTSGYFLELDKKLSDATTKQETLYELLYTDDLSDTTKAVKIRDLKNLIYTQAAAGDNKAKEILDLIQQQQQQSEEITQGLKTKSCYDLFSNLFGSLSYDGMTKAPWEYSDALESVASVDYVTDITKRELMLLTKKEMSIREDEVCSNVLALINKKAEEMKQAGNFEPLPPKEELVQAISRDLEGKDPVTNEQYSVTGEVDIPETNFSNYELKTNDLPTPPHKTLPVYQYVVYPSYNDVEELAAQFDMHNRATKLDEDTYSVSGDDGSQLLVNATSGSFKYYSADYQIYEMVNPGLSESESQNLDTPKLKKKALEFLDHAQLLPDPSLTPQTYQIKGHPTLFVEIHGGDSSTGMPPMLNGLQILNNMGSIVGEPKTFPDYSSLPSNEFVYNTSDKLDGYSRLDDFNTVTIELDKDEKIVSLVFNMRQMKRTLPAMELKTAEEALDDLQHGKGVLDFVLPSTQNPLPGSKEEIFPDNIAKAENVRVDDVFLAYLAKPLMFPQEYMIPAYLFRGETKLDSGYLVNYIVAVNALKENINP